MNKLVINEDDKVGKWVYDRMNGDWTPQRGRAIGLLNSEGELFVGAVFENCNDVNCFVHIAADSSLGNVPRWFIRYCFKYVFEELGCARITGMVNSTNLPACRVNEAFGMIVEGVLKNACPDGHILIYSMFKEDCRWLSEDSNHGKF